MTLWSHEASIEGLAPDPGTQQVGPHWWKNVLAASLETAKFERGVKEAIHICVAIRHSTGMVAGTFFHQC